MPTKTGLRLFVVWLILCSITLCYLLIDHVADVGGRTANTAVTMAAILVALVKVRIIMQEFMGVRSAPRVLGRITDGWVLIMAVALVGCFAVGKILA
ncbi:MAG TPA: cytochrome C oxidase subunit IV family protein [Mycobacteriales bacterium]|nr:cytochrome C oxidase subunit IV family protein [Mycobacteriales bacterium]